jgi:hypothetical protein
MSFVGFKRPRVKNASHLDFIRSLPCVCCGNPHQTEAAHIRQGQLFYGKRPTGGAEKPSDIWTLPLCGEHHREQHEGNEAAFWKARGIEPFILALSLYACSGDILTAEGVINQQAGRDR